MAPKKTSDGTILHLLNEAKKAIGGIKKDKTNTAYNYVYRGIDDALNKCGPVLADFGIVSVPRFTILSAVEKVVSAGPSKERVEVFVRVQLELQFYAPDGSHLPEPIVTLGEGIDYGSDKATSKAMSTAFKYALFLGLMLPVEEGVITDSDSFKKEDERPKANPAAGNQRGNQRAPAQGKQQPRGNQRANPKGNQKGPPPAGGIKERTLADDVRDRLKEIGCKTLEDAGMVLDFVTEGSVKDPQAYKDDPAVAKAVLEELKRASVTFTTERLLGLAGDAKKAELQSKAETVSESGSALTGEPK